MSNNAKALTELGLSKMQEVLKDAHSSDDFLAAAYAVVDDPQYQLNLHVDLGTPDELYVGAKREHGRDASNAERVYEYVGAKDRSNASDARLWTYLAFATYRSYMERRWPLDSVGNWRGRVSDRWLLTNPTRGKLIRHGIARLWWVTELTFDPRCEHALSAHAGDPYAYTKAVLGNEDRVLGLFDREVSTLPAVIRAVLDHAESTPSFAKDKHVRGVMKDLTLEYGFRDLAFLHDDHLAALVSEFGAARAHSE